MPTFVYQAINENGNKVSGVVDAETAALAQGTLNDRGLIPTSVKPHRGGGGGRTAKRGGIFTAVKAPDLILFTKQFQTMIRSGVPMLQILQVLEQQTENKKLKAVLSDMHEEIKRGAGLHEAFLRHTAVFSPLYCSMIQAGEATGSLPEVLERLIYIIDHEHKVRSDIRSALQYPIIVVIFLVIAFFVLLTFVVPQFVKIFQSAGVALPLPTRICMFMYESLVNYWHVMLAGLAAGIAALAYYFKTEQGQYARDTALLKMPLIGPLFVKAAMSRFASIFSIFQASGVPILRALAVLTKTIGNAGISREFNKISNHLEQGRGIAGPLKTARYFPPMVINMVAIGEETGNLDDLLRAVSAHYDTEVEYAVKKLSDSIGPLLTLGLAAIVGFFAFAIFLPMWDLTKILR